VVDCVGYRHAAMNPSFHCRIKGDCKTKKKKHIDILHTQEKGIG
jgi:hypothetical protein